MKLIFIPIEVKARELISKLFFIVNNINEDFIFFIGDKMASKNATSSLGKGVYFYKSINWYDAPHIKRVKGKGNAYVSLDEEGGVTQSNKLNFQSILNRRSSNENVSLVDRIFTWGKFDYEGWSNKYEDYKNKIIKTGHPRFDIWREEIYSKIFKEEILSLRKHSPFFLIIGTFINSYEWLQKEIEHEKKVNKGNEKETIEFLNKRIKQSKDSYKSFKSYVEMIKKLTIDFPKHKIIIKPHPKEDISEWKNKFNKEKYSNVIIHNDFDLTAYIAASDCVIFSESTAGMQSMIMGKKSISYNLKDVMTLRNFANTCAPQTTDYEVLKNFLKNKNEAEIMKFRKKIDERFYITKDTSSKIIMQNIKDIELNNIDMKYFYIKTKLYGFYYYILDNLKFFSIKINNLLFNKTSFKSYSVKMPGGISRREIQTFFEKFNLDRKIKIINFGKNGYIIYKKIR